jgi:hypothetical protein
MNGWDCYYWIEMVFWGCCFWINAKFEDAGWFILGGKGGINFVDLMKRGI